jgi:hypothetical protein
MSKFISSLKFNDAKKLTLGNSFTFDENINIIGPSGFDSLGDTSELTLGDSDTYLRSTFGDSLVLGTTTIIIETVGTERMRIDASGNVGIGTDNPTELLDINGNLHFSGILSGNGYSNVEASISGIELGITNHSGRIAVNESDISGIELGITNHSGRIDTIETSDTYGFADGTSTVPSIYFNSDSDTGIFLGAANELALSTSGSERMRIDSSGNVGIGTATPGYKLDVVGNAVIGTANNEIFIGNIGYGSAPGIAHELMANTTDYALNQTSTGDTNLNAKAGRTLIFRQGNTEKMRVHTDGNVGIGTSAPTFDLEIQKSNPGGTVEMKIFNSSTTAGSDARLQLRTTQSTGGSPSIRFDISSQGTWSMGYNNSDEGFYINRSEPLASTNEFMITSSGNVGIGTATPAQKLDVNGNAVIGTAGEEMFIGNVGHSDWAGIAHEDCANTTDYALIQRNTGAIILNCKAGQSIQFNQGNVNKMIIEATTGNVGIGTNNPTAINATTLHLHDAADCSIILSSDTPLNPNLLLQCFGADNSFIGFDTYYNSGWKSSDNGSNFVIYKKDNLLKFQYDSGIAVGSIVSMNDGMVMNTSGYVGIGTNNPLANLDVYYTENTTFIANTDQGNSKRHIQSYNASGTTNAFANISMKCSSAICDMKLIHLGNSESKLIYTLRTTGGSFKDIMTINHTGNVGIGTTDPEYILDVNGDTRISRAMGINSDGNSGRIIDDNMRSQYALASSYSGSYRQDVDYYVFNGTYGSWSMYYTAVDTTTQFTAEMQHRHNGYSTAFSLYLGWGGSSWDDAYRVKIRRGDYGGSTGTVSAELTFAGSVITLGSGGTFTHYDYTFQTTKIIVNDGTISLHYNGVEVATWVDASFGSRSLPRTRGFSIVSSESTGFGHQVYVKNVWLLPTTPHYKSLDIVGDTNVSGKLIVQKGADINMNVRGYAYGVLSIKADHANLDPLTLYPRPDAFTNNLINFMNDAGTSFKGSIGSSNNTSVSYNTSSDSRLKENISKMSNMLELINNLEPVQYNWIGTTGIDYGFIAQDVYNVLPHLRPKLNNGYTECECDNMHSQDLCHCINHEFPIGISGNPYYYSLDYGKFTPYLAKAIQELDVKINTLFVSNDEILSGITGYIGLIALTNGIHDPTMNIEISSNINDKRNAGVINGKDNDIVIIKTSGEGSMWVCNSAGELENGDYITSSDVAGYGQLQGDDILHNYTVAKITHDCNFSTMDGGPSDHRYIDANGNVITEDTYDILLGVTSNVYRAKFVGCTYHSG